MPFLRLARSSVPRLLRVAMEPLEESWKDAREDPVPIEEPSEQTILRDAW